MPHPLLLFSYKLHPFSNKPLHTHLLLVGIPHFYGDLLILHTLRDIQQLALTTLLLCYQCVEPLNFLMWVHQSLEQQVDFTAVSNGYHGAPSGDNTILHTVDTGETIERGGEGRGGEERGRKGGKGKEGRGGKEVCEFQEHTNTRGDN